jgi:hypothetical protein
MLSLIGQQEQCLVFSLQSRSYMPFILEERSPYTCAEKVIGAPSLSARCQDGHELIILLDLSIIRFTLAYCDVRERYPQPRS